MNRIPLEVDSFHHVYNRGVDKRIVFQEDADYELFLIYLRILNDTEIDSPTRNSPALDDFSWHLRGERLVDIIAYCLMPNHFHLLLHERREGGISKFMQRLGTAYTMYFNEKNDRSGALFQGRFKNKLVDEYNYLLHVIDYLHLNPYDLWLSQNKRVEGRKSISLFLEEYRWSSYQSYLTGTNNPILYREALDEFVEVPADYKSWLFEQNDFSQIGHLLIDDKK
ncbi:MAG: hypothetical protein A2542_03815 [Parcubacteria group bacterium RIFOXYD2_FULL_52_8]|nr:MAG: hypothetical protein A2542_03815 [Parcubacteria group bacterium RIFOXYD2_FULL_52_8]